MDPKQKFQAVFRALQIVPSKDMSAIGPKPTFHDVAFDVAFGGKADMAYCIAHVCF